jgi:hypothetical protein
MLRPAQLPLCRAGWTLPRQLLSGSCRLLRASLWLWRLLRAGMRMRRLL